jgi:hypothetical protein
MVRGQADMRPGKDKLVALGTNERFVGLYVVPPGVNTKKLFNQAILDTSLLSDAIDDETIEAAARLYEAAGCKKVDCYWVHAD